jgi:putrescine aminotransferase
MTAGTLVNAKSIRIQPPAVISEEQIATVLEHMDAALMDVRTKGY